MNVRTPPVLPPSIPSYSGATGRGPPLLGAGWFISNFREKIKFLVLAPLKSYRPK